MLTGRVVGLQESAGPNPALLVATLGKPLRSVGAGQSEPGKRTYREGDRNRRGRQRAQNSPSTGRREGP